MATRPGQSQSVDRRGFLDASTGLRSTLHVHHAGDRVSRKSATRLGCRRALTAVALLLLAAGCGRDPLLGPSRDGAASATGGQAGAGAAAGDGGGAGAGGMDGRLDQRVEAGTDVRPGTVNLSLLPAVAPALPVGQSLQWRALVLVNGIQRDVTSEADLVWSSDDPAVARITERGGRVNGLLPGRTEIRARHPLFGMASASLFVTAATVVRVSVEPPQLRLQPGEARPLAAQAFYSDGTTSDVTSAAEWRSDDQRIARVGNGVEQPGLVTAVASGQVAVSVAFAGAQGQALVVVTSPPVELTLSVSPAALARPVNMTARFLAIARLSSGAITDVTNQAAWSSMNNTVASALGSGQFRCNAVGQVMVTARFMNASATAALQCGQGMNEVRELRLSPVNSSLFVGMRYGLRVEAIFADGTSMLITNTAQVTWSSSDPTLATIDQSGVLTGLLPGTVTITARHMGAMGQEQYTFVAR